MADVKFEKAGLKAVAHGAAPTAVTAGDPCEWHANRDGVPFVIGGHPNTESLHDENTAVNTGEDLKSVTHVFVVTSVFVAVDAACSEDVAVSVKLGSTVVWKHPGIGPGGTASWGDGSGILVSGAAGENLSWTNEVPTNGSVCITVTGFEVDS
jgi:hypothetical protein